jgi:hypothetical protein
MTATFVTFVSATVHAAINFIDLAARPDRPDVLRSDAFSAFRRGLPWYSNASVAFDGCNRAAWGRFADNPI